MTLVCIKSGCAVNHRFPITQIDEKAILPAFDIFSAVYTPPGMQRPESTAAADDSSPDLMIVNAGTLVGV
jgi:hypothetical protein